MTHPEWGGAPRSGGRRGPRPGPRRRLSRGVVGLDRLRGLTVTIPRPGRRLAAEHGWELPAGELTLGRLDVLAQLDEAEGEPTGTDAELLGPRRVELLVLPSLMGFLQREREASDLAQVERWEPTADVDPRVALELGEVELTHARAARA